MIPYPQDLSFHVHPDMQNETTLSFALSYWSNTVIPVHINDQIARSYNEPVLCLKRTRRGYKMRLLKSSVNLIWFLEEDSALKHSLHVAISWLHGMSYDYYGDNTLYLRDE